MLKIRLQILILMSGLFLSTSAWSEIVISKYVFDLDTESSWQVLKEEKSENPFKVLENTNWKSNSPEENFSRGKDIWLRTRLTNKLPTDFHIYFQVLPHFIEEFTVFVLNEGQDKIVHRWQLGKVSFNSGSKASGFSHNFSFQIESGETFNLIIKLKSPIFQNISIRAQDKGSFNSSLVQVKSRHGLIFGLAVMTAVFLLILGIVFDRKIYLAYCLLTFFSILSFSRVFGFFEFDSPSISAWWNSWSIIFFVSMQLAIFLNYFTISDTFKDLSKTRNMFNFFSGLLVLFAFLALLNLESANNFLWIVHLIGLAFSVYAVFLIIKSKERHLWVFVIPFAKQILGMLLTGLMISSKIDLDSLELNLYFLILSDFLFAIMAIHFGLRGYQPTQIFNKRSENQEHKNDSTDIDTETPELAPENISSQSSDQTRLYQEFRIASLGTLTNGLAHELNNPLAIIAGHQYRLSSMVRSKSLNMNDMKTSLGKIEKAVKRVLSVIDALKAYSQDDFSNVDFTSANIRETIQFALDLSRERLNSLGVRLTTQPIPDTFINCNQSQVIQSILILIDNALDAVNEGVNKTIAIEYKQSVTMVEISIIDNGPGVPIANQSRIFDPFFTTKSSKQRKGLGLSIARGLIANHSGKLYLRTDYPQTCFVIQLKR